MSGVGPVEDVGGGRFAGEHVLAGGQVEDVYAPPHLAEHSVVL